MTQYLAGVPALLRQYTGPGGDPYGQAVITAAVDAARLGHASLLPKQLLLKAAVGYLTDEQRTQPYTSWSQGALDWATDKLDGAVRAVEPVAPSAGTGVDGYRPADYLDQYGRRERRDQLGPASLWDALTAYTTSPADLNRLGDIAEERGLYRYAATLWRKGTAAGSAFAAGRLLRLLEQVRSDSVTHVAQWAVTGASLDNPYGVAWLLRGLREAGAHEQVDRLLARDPATAASLDNSYRVAWLLKGLREALKSPRDARAQEQADRLAARAATGVSLDDLGGLSFLLIQMMLVRAREPVATLAARIATDVGLDDPDGAGDRLYEIWRAGGWLAGPDEQAAVLLARDPATAASLGDPTRVASLLDSLRQADAHEQADRLLARDPATAASLENQWDVDSLLYHLRQADAPEQADRLLARLSAGGSFELFLRRTGAGDRFRFGRKADGTPAAPWDWDDLD
jgi:hypothetical protein